MEEKEKPLESLSLDSSKYKTQLTDKFINRKSYQPRNPYLITALIPGTVLKIMTKAGQKVTPGRCILILEAMKMKNRIISEITGIVKEIHVAEGNIVTKNQVLIELIEPEKAKAVVKEKRLRLGRRSRKQTKEDPSV